MWVFVNPLFLKMRVLGLVKQFIDISMILAAVYLVYLLVGLTTAITTGALYILISVVLEMLASAAEQAQIEAMMTGQEPPFDEEDQ